MRRFLVSIALIMMAPISGCSWSEFWGGVFENANGDSYRTDYATNGAFEFHDRYERQAQPAEEYRQE